MFLFELGLGLGVVWLLFVSDGEGARRGIFREISDALKSRVILREIGQLADQQATLNQPPGEKPSTEPQTRLTLTIMQFTY